MKISIDTKEDSHDEIKKVISMLQHLVGGQEVFTNQPDATEATQETASAMANIFGDTTSQSSETTAEPASTVQEPTAAQAKPESTDELFEELFSQEDLAKMKEAETKDKGNEPKGDKSGVEPY